MKNLFPTRLRELRGTRTQREMADTVGVSVASWSAYENGTNEVQVSILTRICEAFKCSSDWLLGLSNTKTISAGTEQEATLWQQLAEKDDTIKLLSASLDRVTKSLPANTPPPQVLGEVQTHTPPPRGRKRVTTSV